MIGKLFTAIKAAINKFVNMIYKRDPVAVFQLKIDEATEKIKRGQERLGEFKGHVNRLQRLVDTDQKNVAVWQERVDAALVAGDDKAAEEADIKLQAAQKSLNDNTAQLTNFRNQYDQQVKMIASSRKTMISAQEECQSLGLKLKMSEANKAAAKLQSEFADEVGNPLGDLNDLRSTITSQIDANNAVGEVNVDLGIGNSSEADTEQKYQSLQASSRLAARKAALGLAKAPAAPAAPQQLPAPAISVEGEVLSINGVPVPRSA